MSDDTEDEDETRGKRVHSFAMRCIRAARDLEASEHTFVSGLAYALWRYAREAGDEGEFLARLVSVYGVFMDEQKRTAN